MASAGKPRLIIADDHALVLESLSTALRDDFAVVGTVLNGIELLDLLRYRVADCLLLDMQLPGKNGLELIPLVRRLKPSLRIIMVTMIVDRRIADAAITAGADGFVPKDAPLTELRTAIHEVLAGHRYVSSRLPKTCHRTGLDAHHVGLNRLTPRQEQIMLLFGEGMHAIEIAEQLHVQPSTITFHKQNIMRVLGIDSESSLLRFAVLVRAGTGAQPSMT